MTEERFAKPKRRRWWLAGLLSVLQPGLGQIYNGQALKGSAIFLVVWVICTIPVSYMLVMHLSVSVLIVVLILGLAVLAAIVADAIVCARKAGAEYSLKPYNRVFVYVGVFIAFSIVSQVESWVVKTYIIQAFKIPAASMAPTLLVGDHILVDKLHGVKPYPNRGDVVVFEYPADPSKEFIKRVEGVAGDIVEIRNKVLYRNGERVESSYATFMDNRVIPAQVAPRDNFGPSTVPKDSVFVMGDNRDQSLDSRFFGFVGKSNMRGVAKCIYFSWDGQSGSVRWDRIGKEIR